MEKLGDPKNGWGRSLQIQPAILGHHRPSDFSQATKQNWVLEVTRSHGDAQQILAIYLEGLLAISRPPPVCMEGTCIQAIPLEIPDSISSDNASICVKRASEVC